MIHEYVVMFQRGKGLGRECKVTYEELLCLSGKEPIVSG